MLFEMTFWEVLLNDLQPSVFSGNLKPFFNKRKKLRYVLCEKMLQDFLENLTAFTRVFQFGLKAEKAPGTRGFHKYALRTLFFFFFNHKRRAQDKTREKKEDCRLMAGCKT